MFDKILNRMRDKILTRDYIMTLHAEEEMVDDGFTILDVEHGILNGEITERQRDKGTKEAKYIIQGPAGGGTIMCVAAKLGPTGKLVIITVFALEN